MIRGARIVARGPWSWCPGPGRPGAWAVVLVAAGAWSGVCVCMSAGQVFVCPLSKHGPPSCGRRPWSWWPPAPGPRALDLVPGGRRLVDLVPGPSSQVRELGALVRGPGGRRPPAPWCLDPGPWALDLEPGATVHGPWSVSEYPLPGGRKNGPGRERRRL